MNKPIEACYIAFGVRVRMMREMLGLTQDELAKKMKISRPSLANIEVGRQRVLLGDVQRFADAIGVAPKQMMKGIWW